MLQGDGLEVPMSRAATIIENEAKAAQSQSLRRGNPVQSKY